MESLSKVVFIIDDAGHAYGLDDMSVAAVLLAHDPATIGHIVSSSNSWGSGYQQSQEQGTVSITMSDGYTEKLTLWSDDNVTGLLTRVGLFNTDTDHWLVTIGGTWLDFHFGTDWSDSDITVLLGGNDSIYGNGYANKLYGYGGGDMIDGSFGIDTAVYSGLRSEYSTYHTEFSSFIDISGPEGQDRLLNIERLQFDDINMAFDINGPTSAGGIYRLYQAAFDRVPDIGGLGYWIAQADNGESGVRMAEDFTWSTEFQQLYGVTTTDNYQNGSNITSLVTGFYQHVLHRAPDLDGLGFYVNTITSHQKTVGQVLAEISNSPENYAVTIGQLGMGIEYTPWIG